MRDFRSVFNIIGMLLCIEALAMLIPMVIDILYNNSDWQIFFFTSLTTFIIGLVLYFSFKHKKNMIKVKRSFFSYNNFLGINCCICVTTFCVLFFQFKL